MKLNFTWILVDFNENEMKMQLSFNSPIDISSAFVISLYLYDFFID